ncbi:MAG: hypothetical protein ACREOZ_04150 [Gloeomargaritales cyanobacterium]
MFLVLQAKLSGKACVVSCGRMKHHDSVAQNVMAVIMASLKVLPGHLGSSDAYVAMGPPWMRLARGMLLVLMSLPCIRIRRACAEELALLAASAISEDAVSIPSSIFASVVESIDATGVDSKQRKAMEAFSYAKFCALLTIGCLQRTSERHAQGKLKAFRHGSGSVLQRPTIRMVRSVLSYLSLDTTLLSVRICSLHFRIAHLLPWRWNRK